MRELSFKEELGFFKHAVDYEDYEKGLRALLGRCHSQDELDTAKVAIDEVKARLMESDKEFKQIIDTRERDAKLQADMEAAIHRASMSESRSDAAKATNDAISKVRSSMRDSEVQEWVSKRKIKTYDPDEKQKQIDVGLYCPICREPNTRGNSVNGVKACEKCWHELVPKDKLKNYPRKYRRRWKKKK